MSKVVQESSGLALSADSRVDAEAGIIKGAKVLGTASRNRRTYPLALLQERFGVYEGAQVYADHDFAQLKHGRARPLGQWGGVLRGVSCQGDGVRGDLHVLRETPAGRVILEAAVRFPEKFGLSAMHVIDSVKQKDGSELVTAILECYSVDAVTRPATTRTLFEQEGDPMADDVPPMDAPPAPAGAMSIEEAFMALQNAVMASTDLEDAERLAVLKDCMKLKSKVLGGGEEEPPEETPAEESERRTPLLGRTAKELAEIKSGMRVLTIRMMAGEGLPLDAPTMQVLLGLPDDAAVGNYLEQLKRQRRPRYSHGPARSSGRSVASESQQTKAPPRLTAGASREDVKRFYRG